MTAPTGTTSTSPAARPRSRIRSAASAVSVTGVVLAMASTAVKPPTAAAREPDAIVSASSRPGSRRWVCRSTNPGSSVEAVGVDALGVRGGVDGADLGDHAVAQQHVAALGGAVGGVPGGPGEEQRAHAAAPSPASRW